MLQPPTNTNNTETTHSPCVAVKLLVPSKSAQSELDIGFVNSYAVVVGVNDYQSGIPQLRTAVNDAKAIAEILKREHGYTLIVPAARTGQVQNEAWLDQDATLENLNVLFEDLKTRVSEGDRLLFYFAGHGIALNNDEGPQGYLIPQDAQQGYVNTYLSMSLLRQALINLSCHHCLIVLDCCYSGSFKWSNTRQLGHYREIYEDNFDLLVSDRAWQVITSAAHDQMAADMMILEDNRDFEGEINSPFAQAFIKALSGEADTMPPAKGSKPAGDGIITAIELCEFIRYQIEPSTAKRGKRQTPELWRVDEKHDKGVYIFFTKYFKGKNSLNKAPEVDDRNNPYRGLESYEEKDSKLFFGRNKIIEDLCDCICDRPLTVVLGASGSGKSSLVKAGLISHLCRLPEETQRSHVLLSNQKNQTHHHKHRQWQILPPIRPGSSPAAELKNVLQQVNLDNIPPGKKLLLVIDQFEEMVTQCNDQTEREKFLQQLSKLLESHAKLDILHIVLILRLDFEPQLRASIEAELKKHKDLTFLLNAQKPQQSENGGLKKRLEERIWDAARFTLGPMTREDLQEAIEAPAAVKAIQFDQEKRDNRILAQQLIHEVADMPGALPLLSFTLRELYRKLAQRFIDARLNHDNPPDRVITWTDYDELGGVARSLTRRATEEYDKLAQDEQSKLLDELEVKARQRVLRWIMLRMIAIDGGEVARKRVLISELEYPDLKDDKCCKEIIDRFSSLKVRLLVKGANHEGKDYIEPAHDILVREWEKIKSWLTERQKETEKFNQDYYIKRKIDEFLNALPLLCKFNENARQESEKLLKVNLLLQHQLTTAANTWLNEKSKQGDRKTIGFLWHQDPRLPQLEQIEKSDDNWFNKIEAEFVQRSRQERENRTRIARGTYAFVVIFFALLSAYQWGQNQQAQSRAFVLSSQDLLTSQQQLESLIEAVKAGKTLKRVSWIPFWLDNDTKIEVITNLQQMISEVKEQNRLQEHAASVTSVSFSPNGQLIASASQDRTINLWSRNGRLLQTFGAELGTGHQGTVTSVSFSPDGKTIASGSEDGTIKLWNLDGTEISSFSVSEDSVTSVRFSPDGTILASGSQDGTIYFWNLDGVKIRDLPRHVTLQGGYPDSVHSLNFSSDGKILISASDFIIRIWHLNGAKIKVFEEKKRISSVTLSSDNQTLAVAGFDNTIKLLNLNGKPIAAPLEGGNTDLAFWIKIHHLSFSPDGKLLASANANGTVKIWNLKDSKQEPILLRGHRDEINAIGFSPDGKFLASASKDTTIKLWQIGNQRTEIQPKQSTVSSASSSPDGERLALAGENGTIQLLNMQSQQSASLQTDYKEVKHVCFSPDGRTLAVTGDDSSVQLWDMGSLRLKDFKLPEAYQLSQACFSPNGKMLAGVDNAGSINIFDSSGKPIQQFQRFINASPAFDISPNEKLLAAPLENVQDVQIVRIEGNKEPFLSGERQAKAIEPFSLTGHQQKVTSVRFSPNSKKLVSASEDGTIKLWSLGESEPITFRGHNGQVLDVDFSPSGKIIASAGEDRTVRVWNLFGRELIAFRGHKSPVTSVSFSSDGYTMVSSDASTNRSADGSIDNYTNTIIAWNLNLDSLLHQGCNQLRDYLNNLNASLTSTERQLCDGIDSSE